MCINTFVATCPPELVEGIMSVARITQKAMVTISREPWVTRRRIVDTLTPCLVTFGWKMENKGPDEDWDPALVIETGSGRGALSAGCLAGVDVRWAVMSDSGTASEVTEELMLSLYPISPRLAGKWFTCRRAVDA